MWNTKYSDRWKPSAVIHKVRNPGSYGAPRQDYLEALDNSIMVWSWLRKHPDRNKRMLPLRLWDLVKEDLFQCPLCTIFRTNQYSGDCFGCPLFDEDKEEGCRDDNSPYELWRLGDMFVKEINATRILNKLKRAYREEASER